MLNRIRSFLFGPEARHPPPGGASLSPLVGADVPSYPSTAPGVPAASVEEILATQAEMIESLRRPSGLTRADFEHLVTPLLRRMVEFIHLFPASANHHHSGVGGLLRHSLEVAFYAVRYADEVEFAPDADPERRFHIRPRWRLATVLVGLLHDLGKVHDITAVSESGGPVWSAHASSFCEWLKANQVQRYYANWSRDRTMRHESWGLGITRMILGRDITQYLIAAPIGDEVLTALYDALAPVPHPSNVLAKLLTRADCKSVSQDLQRDAKLNLAVFNGSRGKAGALLMSALQELAHRDRWQCNRPGAPLWVTDRGTFLLFPTSLRDAYEHLKGMGIVHLPQEPNLLAKILLEHGYVESGADEPDPFVHPVWAFDLTPPGSAQVISYHGLKLTEPGYFFRAGVMPPDPIAAVARAPGPPRIGSADPAPSASSTSAAAPAAQVNLPPRPAPAEAAGAQTQLQLSQPPAAAPAARAAPTSAAPAPDATLSVWFDSAGLIGELLRALAEDLGKGARRWNFHAYRRGERVWLRYPDAVQEYGAEPIKVAQSMREARWLETDPMTPAKFVQQKTIDGASVNVLVLEPVPSANLISIADLVAEDPPASTAANTAAKTPNTPADIAAAAFEYVAGRHARQDYLALPSNEVRQILFAFAESLGLDLTKVMTDVGAQKLIVRRNQDTAFNPDYVPPTPGFFA